MRVKSGILGENATQLEQAREKDFFRLLYIADKSRHTNVNTIDSVEWRLTCNCLDEINHRYADFYFLAVFLAACPLRRAPGRTFWQRYRLPLYLGLVSYDYGLRETSPSPAVQFWNSVCVLDTDMGRVARILHCPTRFYEVVPGGAKRQSSSASSGVASWKETVKEVVRMLFLTRLLSFTFEDSCWKERIGDADTTALVVGSRFFKWKLFELQRRPTQQDVSYRLELGLFPKLGSTRNMRRAYRCKDMILERSTLGGKLWYGSHFTIMRFLGAERGANRRP